MSAVYGINFCYTGPVGKWFGVGLGSKTFTMSDQPYSVIVDGTGKVVERKLGDHSGGQLLSNSITVVSNKAVGPLRTVVLQRPFKVRQFGRYLMMLRFLNLVRFS